MPTAVTAKVNETRVYEDMLFQNRNKEYGAYALRRNDLATHTMAMSVSLLFFISVILLMKYGIPHRNIESVPGKTLGPLEIFEVNFKNKSDIEKFFQKIAEQIPVKPQIKWTTPTIVRDEIARLEDLPTIKDFVGKEISTITRDGDSGGIGIISEVSTVAVAAPTSQPKDEPVVEFVEEQPAFPGGEEALLELIHKNIYYPELARKAGIEGTVYANFVVRSDGSVTDIHIMKSLGGGCDEEAMRVLGLMGRWNPGRQNGRPVSVRVSVPFKFRLQ